MPFSLLAPFTKRNASNDSDRTRMLEEISVDLRRLVRATENLAAATIASAILAEPDVSRQNDTAPADRVERLIASARAIMEAAG